MTGKDKLWALKRVRFPSEQKKKRPQEWYFKMSSSTLMIPLQDCSFHDWHLRSTFFQKLVIATLFFLMFSRLIVSGLIYFLITWVKEDNCFESCILIVIYLDILERYDQLIQGSVGDPTNLRLRAVPVYDAAITCRHSGHRYKMKVCGCVTGGAVECACEHCCSLERSHSKSRL